MVLREKPDPETDPLPMSATELVMAMNPDAELRRPRVRRLTRERPVDGSDLRRDDDPLGGRRE